MSERLLKMHVFYCSNNLEQDQLNSGLSNLKGVNVKTIGLPCSGKVDIPYLMKAFETGADGAVIVTCKQDECRHIEGNLRAQKRAEAVESLLEEIGMDKGRMAVVVLSQNGAEQAIGEIRDFVEKVKALPQQRIQSSTVNK